MILFYLKKGCNSCTKSCKYDANSIKALTQSKVIDELARHGHSKSRKIGNKMRTTDQSKEELLIHYQKIHKIFID